MIPDRVREDLTATDAGGALTPAEFRELRDLLYARSGLYFDDGKKFLLESRLQKRLRALNVDSGAAYLAMLASPERGTRELAALLDVVTTHETSFFRSRRQLEVFQRRVLPEAAATQTAQGRLCLRIWSAACSSGEEPYTLALMILEKLGSEACRWDIRIVGTDIALSVLERAREGVYGRHSFRNTPAYFIQKYFRTEGPDAFRLVEEPRRLVTFRQLNFADAASMGRMRGFHVIFCRNALIYFDREAKRRFVSHFAEALDPGGYFFVGQSESLHGVSDAFKLIHFPGALAYKKPAPDANGS